MHPHEALIHSFYRAFQKKDFRTMAQAYRPDATFSDPVFQNLSAGEVKAMWQMLLTSAEDLTITYNEVIADAHVGQCHWEARYTFSASGRTVNNKIDAKMQFRDGKIFKHEDHFSFWSWSRMALGMPGLLLGWSPYMIHAVRAKARKRLTRYIGENNPDF